MELSPRQALKRYQGAALQAIAGDGLCEGRRVADAGFVILRISRKEWLAQVANADVHGHGLEETIAAVVADIAVENKWCWGDKALDVRQIKTGEDQTKAAHYLAKALQYVTKDVMHDREHPMRPEAREHFERLDCAARDMVCDHCEGGAMACGACVTVGGVQGAALCRKAERERNGAVGASFAAWIFKRGGAGMRR